MSHSFNKHEIKHTACIQHQVDVILSTGKNVPLAAVETVDTTHVSLGETITGIMWFSIVSFQIDFCNCGCISVKLHDQIKH